VLASSPGRPAALPRPADLGRDEARHAARVLRLRVGERLLVAAPSPRLRGNWPHSS